MDHATRKIVKHVGVQSQPERSLVAVRTRRSLDVRRAEVEAVRTREQTAERGAHRAALKASVEGSVAVFVAVVAILGACGVLAPVAVVILTLGGSGFQVTVERRRHL